MVFCGEATDGKAGDRGDNCSGGADGAGGGDSTGRDVCADRDSGDCVAARDSDWGTDCGCGCDCCNENEVGGGSDSSSRSSGTGLGACSELSYCSDMVAMWPQWPIQSVKLRSRQV